MQDKQEKIKRKTQKVIDNNGSTPLAHLDVAMETNEKLEELVNPERVQKMEIMGAEIITIQGKPGDKGDSPTDEELISLIEPLIPEPIKGEDGKDYILTKEDKKEIAKEIKVPIVEKIIEKTETIIEKPTVTEVVKEVAKYQTAGELASSLETLEGDDRLSINAIKGIDFVKTADFKLAMSNIKGFMPYGNGSSSSQSGGVTSVSNSDSTLTISPTTGAVVASLNLGNANTWTATQTFDRIKGNTIQAVGSGGILFESNSGTDVALFGAGGGAGVTFYGGITQAGQYSNTFTSLVSTPAGTFTGTWFTGGTSTTTKPHFLVEPSGATSTGWSINGTGLGINSASGFTGNLLDLQNNGTQRITVTATGLAQFNSTGTAGVQSHANRGQIYLATNLITSGNGDLALMARQGFGIGFGVSAANGTTNTIAMSISNVGKVGIGLGLTPATAFLHIVGTTEQQRTSYDASNYYTATVSSAGAVTFDAVGASAGFTFSDNVSAPNVTASGNVVMNGATSVLKLKQYTVATLPAGAQGDVAYVTDALAPAYNVAVAGGGGVAIKVFRNATVWVCA